MMKGLSGLAMISIENERDRSLGFDEFSKFSIHAIFACYTFTVFLYESYQSNYIEGSHKFIYRHIKSFRTK